MKIGIFGGSFNPIHYGHLMLAEHVADAAGIDRVILVPAYESPFKSGTGGAGSLHNLNMTRIAAEGNERFLVSSYEVDQQKMLYTVDTMRAFTEAIRPDHPLSFIMGGDSFLSLEKWRRADELLRNYPFLIGVRPGSSAEEVEKTAVRLRMEYNADIRIIQIPQVDISSTNIRNRIHEGKSIRYLTPNGVIDYILQHNLYAGSTGQGER